MAPVGLLFSALFLALGVSFWWVLPIQSAGSFLAVRFGVYKNRDTKWWFRCWDSLVSTMSVSDLAAVLPLIFATSAKRPSLLSSGFASAPRAIFDGSAVSRTGLARRRLLAGVNSEVAGSLLFKVSWADWADVEGQLALCSRVATLEPLASSFEARFARSTFSCSAVSSRLDDLERYLPPDLRETAHVLLVDGWSASLSNLRDAAVMLS
jgi:hypothetical protein